MTQCLIGITTCWIAAERALQHARNNMSLVSEVFDKLDIQKSQYVVLAGFDESLIRSSVGYLEQIHVFVKAEIDTNSPLLSELGKVFFPFSSILFTESYSYHLPVFKDDGSCWEFDELVYFTASKSADGGSSSKTPLNSISQTPSQGDDTTGSSGGGDGEKSKKLGEERGSDSGDKGDGDKDNNQKNPSKDPEVPAGGGLGDGTVPGPVKISISVESEIRLIDKRLFQTLKMQSSLTVEVFFLLLLHYSNA
jgi:hypothetical protein